MQVGHGRCHDGLLTTCPAAIAWRQACVSLLISAGADVNCRTKTRGWSALHFAATAGGKALTCASRLLEAGADAEASGADSLTPGALAESLGHGDAAHYLVRAATAQGQHRHQTQSTAQAAALPAQP